jgi:putative membrane protein
MKPAQRKPTAFRLDDVSTISADYVPGLGAPPVLTPEADAFAEAENVAAIVRPKRRIRWARLLVAGLGGLVALAIGLAIDGLIRDLFSRNDALGWLAVGLAALAGIAVLAIAIREIAGLLRIRAITTLHAGAVEAIATDDRNKARRVARDLMALYSRRPEMGRGRSALAGHMGEIIDGRDLIGLAETELILPLDDAARRMVLAAAKRVALVTTVSPRALVDVLFVALQILRLIRQLATLYAGRPGTLGFLRLTRAAMTHLAVTGGIAAGDSLVQQILGHGLAARLSARLGEGVINGLLTARVGIAAIEVCRPLPFVNGKPPRLADVMAELRRMGSGEQKPVSPDG